MTKNYAFSIKSFGLALAFSFSSFFVSAQNLPKVKNAPTSKDRGAKVHAELMELQKKSSNPANPIKGDLTTLNKYLQVKNGYVIIDVTSTGDTPALLAELRALGMKDASSYGRVVSGKLPVSAINSLPKIKTLKYAKPSYKPHANVGLVTSQGDTAQRSHVARSKFDVDGKDITVGVLSDSYNYFGDADSTIITGDLPGPGNPYGYTTPVEVLMESEEGVDEGRAMIEIVHDVAPGAKLQFHTAYNGQAGFANGILSLAKAGSDVIVDDIIYFAEPFFQDGIIAQAVDEVAKQGVSYFSAAGNQARDSYEAGFKNSGITPLGPDFGPAHDFGNGDILQQITIPTGGSLLIVMQWADPFYSVSGVGAKTDLDIFLMNEAGDELISGSAAYNVGDDPVEVFYFYNDSEETTFNILITKFEGPDPKVIKYIDFEGWLTFDEYKTNSSTNYGHSNAKGAIAVGAARYDKTPEYGVNPPLIEAFSSAGGTKILFDTQGNPIKPENRFKPEITAPDGNNTTFFIPGLDYEGDGWPNFFGTSAAAPHAAGVAALMLDATNKGNKKEVKWALQNSAIDMDDPLTPAFDYGFDYVSGHGLIQADKAVGALMRGRKDVKYLYLSSVCSEDPSSERRWRIKNPNKFPINVMVTVLNSEEVEYVDAQPGYTYFTTETVPHLNLAFISWKDEDNQQKLIGNISFGQSCGGYGPFARTAEPQDASFAEEAELIQASPNPTSDRLKLQLSNLELQNVKVTVLNPQGKSVYNKIFDATKGVDEIDMSSMPRGIYLVKVQHELYTKTIKIIKQ